MKQEAHLLERKNTADSLRINSNNYVPLPELFEDICKLPTEQEQIDLIMLYANSNQNSENLLKNYIQSVYHPAVILDFPSEKPPYKNDNFVDYSMAPVNMTKALQRIKHFVKGNPAYIENRLKREEIFVRTLEEMYKDNSELYTYILIKEIDQLKYPGINDSLFLKAFPNWFPENYQLKKNSELLTNLKE